MNRREFLLGSTAAVAAAALPMPIAQPAYVVPRIWPLGHPPHIPGAFIDMIVQARQEFEAMCGMPQEYFGGRSWHQVTCDLAELQKAGRLADFTSDESS